MAKKIAIDLGTGHIKVCVRGKGIVLDTADAIAYDTRKNTIIAVGDAAADMEEKAPEGIRIVRPVHAGAVADLTAMNDILCDIFHGLCGDDVVRPDVILCMPHALTDLERSVAVRTVFDAGAGSVSVLPAGIASAVGCAGDKDRSYGLPVIDIGSGNTDISIVNFGTVAFSSCLRYGGDDMDEKIVQYVRLKKNIQIGRKSAEKIKKTIGCATPLSEQLEMFLPGKDVVTGLPVTFSVTSDEISEALSECVDVIVAGIRELLDLLPAEIFSDLCSSGFLLTGGVSRLKNLDACLSGTLRAPVTAQTDPEHTAARGAVYVLSHEKDFTDESIAYKLKQIDRL